MKTPFLLVALLAPVLLYSAPAPAPAVNSRAQAQSERIKLRIDALLKHRLKPEPLPVVLPNPFSAVSSGANNLRPDGSDSDGPDGPAVENPAAPTSPSDKPAGDLPPATNSEALARYSARLRIGGMVRLKGQLQIVVNDAPRKEGDTIVLDRNNPMTYLQVVKIAPGELTLRLNDATQTIKF